jgi:cyclophilin family peptidyl-prolyl cis-trans isomerase
MRKSVAILMVLLVVCFATTGLASGKKEKGKENPMVIMDTSLGKIKIELWADKAPITVENFLRYVDEGFYNGTIFHRVISNFMIQGGGFTKDMEQKATHEPIRNEAAAELKNKRGVLAMARTQIVDSATAQFFINVVDNDFLDHQNDSPQGFGYAAFGEVVDGMDVVDKIRNVKTTSVGPYQDVPAEPVIIEKVEREKE